PHHREDGETRSNQHKANKTFHWKILSSCKLCIQNRTLLMQGHHFDALSDFPCLLCLLYRCLLHWGVVGVEAIGAGGCLQIEPRRLGNVEIHVTVSLPSRKFYVIFRNSFSSKKMILIHPQG